MYYKKYSCSGRSGADENLNFFDDYKNGEKTNSWGFDDVVCVVKVESALKREKEREALL